MAVTRETSRFGDGPSVKSVEDFKWVRKLNITYEQRARTSTYVGAGDWRVHNFELSTDGGFLDCQTQHRANLMHQPAKMTRIISIITSHGSKVPVSHHRRPFSVVATSVLPAQQMAKRSRPFTDEASKHTGASSKVNAGRQHTIPVKTIPVTNIKLIPKQ